LFLKRRENTEREREREKTRWENSKTEERGFNYFQILPLIIRIGKK
jgi:hypothetical protein